MVSSGVVYIVVLETTKYVKFKVNCPVKNKKKRVLDLNIYIFTTFRNLYF